MGSSGRYEVSRQHVEHREKRERERKREERSVLEVMALEQWIEKSSVRSVGRTQLDRRLVGGS